MRRGAVPQRCLPWCTRSDGLRPASANAELSDDPIIRNHLAALYDTLLEQNLVRIIEPYSRVEIKHVAEMVKQPVRDVEIK